MDVRPGSLYSSTFLFHSIEEIRLQNPLIHNITNQVVMNLTANALLAIGASPVMSYAFDEVEELISLSKALVVNIGTLDHSLIKSANLAVAHANQLKIPVVLDPVGAGASQIRTNTAKTLLKNNKISVLRGNASEIIALSDSPEKPKGVDSAHSSEQALKAGKEIASRYNICVVISGETDLVIDSRRVARIYGGHPIMPKVTGMGCTASALTAAFCAASPSSFDAAIYAMAVMGATGKIAGSHSQGPGTFVPLFLDTLFNLKASDLKSVIEVEEV